jgi:hypothetical protein
MLAALQHSLEQTLADIVKERPAIRAFLALLKAKGVGEGDGDPTSG